MVALMKFFYVDAKTNTQPYQYHGILILTHYDNIW